LEKRDCANKQAEFGTPETTVQPLQKFPSFTLPFQWLEQDNQDFIHNTKLSENMNKMIHRSSFLFPSLPARLPIVSCTLLAGDALACRCATEMSVQ